jgi:hypothetical protein
MLWRHLQLLTILCVHVLAVADYYCLRGEFIKAGYSDMSIVRNITYRVCDIE